MGESDQLPYGICGADDDPSAEPVHRTEVPRTAMFDPPRHRRDAPWRIAELRSAGAEIALYDDDYVFWPENDPPCWSGLTLSTKSILRPTAKRV